MNASATILVQSVVSSSAQIVNDSWPFLYIILAAILTLFAVGILGSAIIEAGKKLFH